MPDGIDAREAGVEVALAGGARLPPGLRARLLGPWGMVAKLRGDYAAAVAPFEESLTLFRSIGDEWHAAVYHRRALPRQATLPSPPRDSGRLIPAPTRPGTPIALRAGSTLPSLV